MSVEVYEIGASGDMVLVAPLLPTGRPRLPDSVNYGERKCAGCGQSDSTLWCESCSIIGVAYLRVFYCSKDCKASHQSSHHEVCLSRRQLARAVGILGDTWTTFEVATFAADEVFDHVQDGTIFLKHVSKVPDPRGWMGASIFRPFEREVFPEATDHAIKRAVLFSNNCAEVVTAGLGLLDIFLKPLCDKLEEAVVKPKNPALVVAGSQSPNHGVLRATLSTGEVFAVDLTGAQYGWDEQLYTWDAYTQHRATVESITPLGHTRQWQRVFMATVPPGSPAHAVTVIRNDILMPGLEDACRRFFRVQGISLRDFLSQRDDNFTASRLVLAMLIVQAYMALMGRELQKRRIGSIYFDKHYFNRVTVSEADAERYKNVWLSPEEYEANKDDVGALKKIWEERRRNKSQ